MTSPTLDRVSEQDLQARLATVLQAITRSQRRLEDLVDAGTDDHELVETLEGDLQVCGNELSQTVKLAHDVYMTDGERTARLMIEAGLALHELALYPLPPRNRTDTNRLARLISLAAEFADGPEARRAISRLLALVGVTTGSPFFLDSQRLIRDGHPGEVVANIARRHQDQAWADLVLAYGPLTCLAALVDQGGPRRVEEIATVLHRRDPTAAARLRRLGTGDAAGASHRQKTPRGE